jgi:hypothetical protein
MSGYDGKPGRRGPALDLVQLRVAHAAHGDLYKDSAFPGNGNGKVDEFQRRHVLTESGCSF